MRELSKEQVDFILDDFQQKGIEMEELRFSLLDHICCLIEEKWGDNRSFESVYRQLLPLFFEKELGEIQKETDLLLTFKNYYAMKKTMMISGGFVAISFVLGSLFKIFHLPGAGILYVLAMTVFSFIFLPLLFLLKSKDLKVKREKITLGIGTFVGILFCLGSLFKVMHWPGANMLWYTSLGLLFLVFLPLHYFGGIRNEETRLNTITSSILILVAGGLTFYLTSIRPSARLEESMQSAVSQSELLIQNLEARQNPTENLKAEAVFNLITTLKQEMYSSVYPENEEDVSRETIINERGMMYFEVRNVLFDDDKKPHGTFRRLLDALEKFNSELIQVNGKGLFSGMSKTSGGKVADNWAMESMYMTNLSMAVLQLNQLELQMRMSL
jgi:hypothetical protein